jgi:inhibitor of KinA
MELTSVQFNGVTWTIFRLGEEAWLLKPKSNIDVLELIQKTARMLEQDQNEVLIDVIPAYDTLTLVFKSPDIVLKDFLASVSITKANTVKFTPSTHEINVCYDLGLDWDEMENATGLAKNEIISIHSSKEYTIAMIGFLPGFIFLEGLDERIHVQRKSTPRTSVPKGAIGIGGSQTGMYALESPGGWQIIGKTPQKFFDVENNPPHLMVAGDRVRFTRISEQEFKEWEPKDG